MRLIRAACCAYWCLLSLLLLHPDPASLLGLEGVPGPPGGRGTHFMFFVGLAFLTAAGRFPVRRGVPAAILVVYALAMEALQAFVPDRTVDAFDALENLMGLVAGGVLWWIVWRRWRPRMAGAMTAYRRRDP
jgi:uncharacterized membrane protein YccC